MSECNHIFTTGAYAGHSAVSDGLCYLCGHRAANPMGASGVQHEKGAVTSETLQPFDKMQPGEIDKIFKASCPKCDGRIWRFLGRNEKGEFTTQSAMPLDQDVRQCVVCSYLHWLRGPNTSEVIPLQTAAGPSKKDRVRALVFAILASPSIATYPADGLSDFVRIAQEIDREIEATK
jgi:hypothetical protein